tara:strand:+ start:5878 stop:6612 length:735 start_codon:yes stop_codon:yes gene_type:complete
MGALLKQDAVNQMLLASGETMVNDLTTDSGVDTSVAEFMLDQVTRDWQTRGIAENEVVTYYAPDSNDNNKIVLKQGTTSSTDGSTIYAELLSNHWTAYSVDGRPQQLIMSIIRHDGTQTGGNPNYKPILYNIIEDTSAWVVPTNNNGKYTVLERIQLSWNDMSTPIQQAITDRAGREYQMLTTGDGDVDRALAQKEQMSRMRARASDIAHKQRNIFIGGDHSIRRAGQRHRWGDRTNSVRSINY